MQVRVVFIDRTILTLSSRPLSAPRDKSSRGGDSIVPDSPCLIADVLLPSGHTCSNLQVEAVLRGQGSLYL